MRGIADRVAELSGGRSRGRELRLGLDDGRGFTVVAALAGNRLVGRVAEVGGDPVVVADRRRCEVRRRRRTVDQSDRLGGLALAPVERRLAARVTWREHL